VLVSRKEGRKEGRKAHQLWPRLCDTSTVTFVWKIGYNLVITDIIRRYWHGDVIEGAMEVCNASAYSATFKG
jgi:hypothetical protein